MSFSPDKAQVASLFVEAILYGLYIFLFCCTIYVLVYKRTTRRPHYGMLFVTLFLFGLATSHIVTNFLRLLDAFSLAHHQPGAVLKDPKSFKNIFKTCVLVTEILAGDVVLIYRCYVAWGGRIRIILLPLVVLLATAVTSTGFVYNLAKAPAHTDLFAIHGIQSFITSTQVLVLVNHVVCTGLLAYRLWSMSRAMISRTQRHSLRSVALIIAESGLITALTWLLFIITYAVKSPAEVIVIDALAPITGGAFCLIVSRVALGVDNEVTSPTSEAVHYRGDEASVLPVFDGTGRPHRPMEISVSSRQSVRIETEMDTLEQDKKAFAALTLL